MSDWVIWRAAMDGACRAMDFVGFDDEHLLMRGEALSDRWPAKVRLELDDALPVVGVGPGAKKCRPEQVVVPDALPSRRRLVLVSQRLGDVIRANVRAGVEYLPLGLKRAKGVKWPSEGQLSQPYVIVNPTAGLVDCLDEAKSGAKRDRDFPEAVARLKRLVIDPKKVPADLSIFRIAHLRQPVLVRRALMEALAASGSTGVAFEELEDFQLA